MTVVVNGIARQVAGRTVAEVVRDLGRDPAQPGLAVARNGEVVPRAAWGQVRLRDGDHVEVLMAVSGG